ncbi:MAG: hypothetical protein OHK0045_08400 [Raineya sp.]
MSEAIVLVSELSTNFSVTFTDIFSFTGIKAFWQAENKIIKTKNDKKRIGQKVQGSKGLKSSEICEITR